MPEIIALDGFDWDDGNLSKNWEAHRVTPGECEQVFFNAPLLLADDIKHSGNGARYYVLGRTDAGRLLFIAFTVRETKIRVISARPMSRRERSHYEATS